MAFIYIYCIHLLIVVWATETLHKLEITLSKSHTLPPGGTTLICCDSSLTSAVLSLEELWLTLTRPGGERGAERAIRAHPRTPAPGESNTQFARILQIQNVHEDAINISFFLEF